MHQFSKPANLSSLTRRAPLLFALATANFAQANAACPASFDPFIRQFETTPSLQLAQTQFPLLYRSIDQNDPEMKMKETRVTRQNREKHELFPSAQFQQEYKLIKKLQSPRANRCTVTFSAPDSDSYSLVFKFEKRAGKWVMVEVENHSL
jgi:hypothetical protein